MCVCDIVCSILIVLLHGLIGCAHFLVILMQGGGGGDGKREYQLSLVEFGCHELSVWYASPYPPDFTSLPKIFLCQFCLKYFKSSPTLHRHAVSHRWGEPLFVSG